jgi:hypothetical protein
MQLAVFVRGNHMRFGVAEEAIFMPVKGATYTCIFVLNEMQQILALIQKLDAPVTDGASCMTGRNSGVSMLFTNAVKNAMDRVLILLHYLIHQRSPCAKLLRKGNVVPLVR